MKVVPKSSQVTASYIMNSLHHQYAGKSYKFTDRLTKILARDAKKKAENLEWLFGEDTRIKLSLNADIVYKNLISRDTTKDLVTLLEAIGITIVPEDFIKGFCIYKKQRVRISTILKNPDELLDEATNLPSAFLGKYTTSALKNDGRNKYKESHLKIANMSSLTIHNGLPVTVAENQISFYPSDSLKIQVISGFSEHLNIENVIKEANMSDVYLSIDINDFITCSSGSCRSCLRIDGQHHLGWMQHYRSDFSVIMFTHSSHDEFDKTGRAWISVRITEDGVPYVKPFFKMSKTYGVINQAHRQIVNDYIQEAILKRFNMEVANKVTEFSSGSHKLLVSPNIAGTGHSVTASGYFDWDTGSDNPFYVYPSDIPALPVTNENYRYGPQCIFPYPDALDVNGVITNTTNFQNTVEGHLSSHIGFVHADKFVICNATNEEVILSEAVRLPDGSYISKDVLLQKAFPELAIVVQEEVAVTPVEDIDIDSVDVEDF